MIVLSETVVAQFEHLKAPPTHARCIYLRHAAIPDDFDLNGAIISGIPAKDHVEAVYAYGSLNESGAFVVNTFVTPVHVLVDTKDYSAEAAPPDDAPQIVKDAHVTKLEWTAAFNNLRSAGVAPTPGSPHVPTTVAAKREDDFRKTDLDAVVSYFYSDQLGGTIV